MDLHPYRGIRVAIATKHRKEQIIAPEFSALEISLQLAEIDTDLLGTFTGEVEREGTPKEVAVRKARLGMQATGLKHGIASEGSIGPDPIVPFLSSDIECLAWVDDELGIEIVEFYRSMEITAVQQRVVVGEDLSGLLSKADFPNHGLIVKSGDQIIKGINSQHHLDQVLAGFENGASIMIESDLRAHYSPSRQKNIQAVAKQLADRLVVLCKECGCPGFGVVGNLYGLECEECRNFNEKAVRGKLFGCAKCDYKVEQINERTFVAAADCQHCNP